MSRDPAKRETVTGVRRWVLLATGVGLTMLATVGALLPVLPTTPFLLLAAACFARSSPAFHRRLLANPMFGPYITQWQHDHTIPKEAKRRAYLVVAITFTASIYFVDQLWLRVGLAVTGISLIGFLAWLPTTGAGAQRSDDPSH